MQQGILNPTLGTMISNTVIASWNELMAPHDAPNVHVEYHRVAPNKGLQYLKIWAAQRRGAWRLVCQYWTAPGVYGSVQGMTFSPPFYSANFAHLLVAVIENQTSFSDLEEQTRDGLLQISAPSDEERATAVTAMQVTLTDLGICDREPSEE
jgi:hypothetical protein